MHQVCFRLKGILQQGLAFNIKAETSEEMLVSGIIKVPKMAFQKRFFRSYFRPGS
jgi:hypothetical protein